MLPYCELRGTPKCRACFGHRIAPGSPTTRDESPEERPAADSRRLRRRERYVSARSRMSQPRVHRVPEPGPSRPLISAASEGFSRELSSGLTSPSKSVPDHGLRPSYADRHTIAILPPEGGSWFGFWI